jgi:hypothetical protein
MPKKKFSVVCLSLLLLIAATLAGLVGLLKYEPHFYRDSTIPPSAERTERSNKVVNQLLQLAVDLKFDQENWHHEFCDFDINSFFQEDFVKPGGPESLRKMGASDPRVAFQDGVVRIAFRYGRGLWSTVISCDLKVWVVPKETNVVAVEVLARRAGALPIASQALIGPLTEALAKRNIEVTPYRHEGHLVVLLHFHADQPRPMALLRCVQVAPGQLSVEASNGSKQDTACVVGK